MCHTKPLKATYKGGSKHRRASEIFHCRFNAVADILYLNIIAYTIASCSQVLKIIQSIMEIELKQKKNPDLNHKKTR